MLLLARMPGAVFYYLAVLNLGDALFTHFGLSEQLISETNPLMAAVYLWSPVAFISGKVLLSFLLILLLTFKSLPFTRMVLSLGYIAALAYTIVVGMHVIWFWKLTEEQFTINLLFVSFLH